MTKNSVGTLPTPSADDIQSYIAEVAGELSTLADEAGLENAAMLLKVTSRVATGG